LVTRESSAFFDSADRTILAQLDDGGRRVISKIPLGLRSEGHKPDIVPGKKLKFVAVGIGLALGTRSHTTTRSSLADTHTAPMLVPRRVQ
jgi:hypothetical protein